jgi:hypothetical protein
MGFFNGFSSRRKADFRLSEKRDSKPDGALQDRGFSHAEMPGAGGRAASVAATDQHNFQRSSLIVEGMRSVQMS